MTWDKLVDEWRVKLQEAGRYIKMLQDALVILADGDKGADVSETTLILVALTSTLNEIHGACESIAIGVDALASMVRELTTEEEAEEDPENMFASIDAMKGHQFFVRELVGTPFVIASIRSWRRGAENGVFAQIQLDTGPAFFLTTQPTICGKLRMWSDEFPRQATITEERTDGRGRKYFDIE